MCQNYVVNIHISFNTILFGGIIIIMPTLQMGMLILETTSYLSNIICLASNRADSSSGLSVSRGHALTC